MIKGISENNVAFARHFDDNKFNPDDSEVRLLVLRTRTRELPASLQIDNAQTMEFFLNGV